MLKEIQNKNSYNITVAGIGYVGLSVSVLLSQQNTVVAVDIDDEKINRVNQRVCPIKDEYIEKYFAEKKLNLTATDDYRSAYSEADFVVIATPTNYDSEKNFFDTSAVDSVIEQVIVSNSSKREGELPTIVIKSTVPVGYTESVRRKYGYSKILFSPEFLRESKALYDNLSPSRIILGCDKENLDKAEVFSELLKNAAIKENIPILFMGYT